MVLSQATQQKEELNIRKDDNDDSQVLLWYEGAQNLKVALQRKVVSSTLEVKGL